MANAPVPIPTHRTHHLVSLRRSLSQAVSILESVRDPHLSQDRPRPHVEPLRELATPPPLHSRAPPPLPVHGMAWRRARLVVVGLPGATSRGDAVSVLILHIDAMRTADELQPMLELTSQKEEEKDPFRYAMPHASLPNSDRLFLLLQAEKSVTPSPLCPE